MQNRRHQNCYGIIMGRPRLCRQPTVGNNFPASHADPRVLALLCRLLLLRKEPPFWLHRMTQGLARKAHLCRDSSPPTSTSQAINLSASSITKVCMQSPAQGLAPGES